MEVRMIVAFSRKIKNDYKLSLAEVAKEVNAEVGPRYKHHKDEYLRFKKTIKNDQGFGFDVSESLLKQAKKQQKKINKLFGANKVTFTVVIYSEGYVNPRFCCAQRVSKLLLDLNADLHVDIYCTRKK